MTFRWVPPLGLRLVPVLGLLSLAVGVGYAGDTAKLESAPKPRAEGEAVEVSPAVEIDRKVIAEVKANAQLQGNLQHLCDVIGPRVTGSANLEKANKWAAEKMKEYGLTNVKLEPWEIPVAWERGTVSFKMVEPNPGKALIAASMAWTPGTKGKITGEVVFLDAKTKDDLAKYKGKLKNAIILRSTPSDVKPITDMTYLAPPVPKEAPKKDEPKKEEVKKEEPTKTPETLPQPGPRPTFADMRAYRAALGEFLKAEGAAAILLDSAKPHGLLTMTGSWPEGDRGTAGDPIPTLFVTHENYSMLHRLATAKDGPRPQVELEVTNKFIPGPITVYNTVGEITGSEKPDEFVVVGAHLDSWDLGTGATDNGTGSCTVLEIARTLATLAKQGVRPKRTIRFALFSGEEQGLFGSKQYVKRHMDEMPKTSMALVHDTGTGKVQGFGLQGREAVRKILDPELETLKTVDGWKGVSLRGMGGTDHLSFEKEGVPGFACDQEMDEYRLTHHTQTDTFDHVKIPNLVQGAQVMGVTALRVANLPELLPRDKKKEVPKTEEEPKKEPKKDGLKKDDEPKK